MADPSAASADAEAPEPIAIGEAIGRLDDEEFAELVVDLWEERGWTVREGRTPTDSHLEVLFGKEWPEKQLGVVRIVRPSSGQPITGTEIEHFVRDLQRERADWSRLVTADRVPDSVRARGTEYDVEVRDRTDLTGAIEGSAARDLLTRHVDAPVEEPPDPAVSRAATEVATTLEGRDSIERVKRELLRRLPPDPTVGDLVFAGFRVAAAAATGLFLLSVLVGPESIVFGALTALFLLAVYAGLLPVMVADIYLCRGALGGSWCPSWVYLVGFPLSPTALAAAGVYWYRRRKHVADGAGRTLRIATAETETEPRGETGENQPTGNTET